ncbi:MAG TPA: hypothetical protein VME40_03705, partial [Caulobacteraceae bacterium]|nr:hypothetical protein [Caulobacteraceae bacterium]
QLLFVVRIMLDYGRHLAATIDRRAAAPGFRLFAALFGSAKLPVIHAHLRRGILRAAALESLLLQRAATGRDVDESPGATPQPGAHAGVDPLFERLDIQIARLVAQRAEYDAPVDPDLMPDPSQIEAEILSRPLGRTIADIGRDLGIVPGLCTRAFCDAVLAAIACYHDSDAACREDIPPEPPQAPPQPDTILESQQTTAPGHNPAPQRTRRRKPSRVHHAPAAKPGKPRTESRPVMPAPMPLSAEPRRHNVTIKKYNTASPTATGPPPRAPMRRAA